MVNGNISENESRARLSSLSGYHRAGYRPVYSTGLLSKRKQTKRQDSPLEIIIVPAATARQGGAHKQTRTSVPRRQSKTTAEIEKDNAEKCGIENEGDTKFTRKLPSTKVYPSSHASSPMRWWINLVRNKKDLWIDSNVFWLGPSKEKKKEKQIVKRASKQGGGISSFRHSS